jgi:hypothetical protein
MTEPLFSNSLMKLRRAEQFIAELEVELNRYRQDDPFQASWAFDENPPKIRVDWKAITDFPGAIVGDAIHNMRTALDLMASELVRLSNQSDSNVYFPFGYSAEELEKEIKRKNFYKAGQDAVDLLWRYAPHRGGNETLRALHDLDVRDKHKALVLMGSTMNLKVTGSYNIETLEADDPPIVEGDVHYVFPEPEAFKGRPVIETLKELVQLVNSIIEAFASMVALRTS